MRPLPLLAVGSFLLAWLGVAPAQEIGPSERGTRAPRIVGVASAQAIDPAERAAREARIGQARTHIQATFARGGSFGEIARTQSRIINGDDIAQTDRDWEWTISLRRNDSHRCGGSLVSPIVQNGTVTGWRNDDPNPVWVVTAAHCVWDSSRNTTIPEGELKVASGNVKMLGDLIKQDIDEIIVPDQYDHNTLENDIALLRLEPPSGSVPDDARRNSIILPDGTDARWLYESYTALTVTGWGRTVDSHLSDTLQRVLVPLVDMGTCQEAYDRHNERVNSGMVCGGFSSGGYDSCQGDSGGPAVFRPARAFGDPSNEPILAGVVSWGIGCALEGLYGVYTNVLAYRPWLEQEVGERS